MIKAYIPSKDRPAQCELLLESLQRNAPHLFSPHVVWTGSDDKFVKGYEKLIKKRKFRMETFIREDDSEKCFYDFLKDPQNDYVALFADDCIFYRKTRYSSQLVRDFLNTTDDVWCFSFRLGSNITVQDYVTNSQTVQPKSFLSFKNGIQLWNYREIDRWGLFGFENGFDGYVYKAKDLLWIADGGHFDRICFWEHMVCNNGRRDLHSKNWMASPLNSCVFVQQINVTHNFQHRSTGVFNKSLAEINDMWLNNYKIDLSSIDWTDVNCTHGERPFKFVIAEKLS